jgi:hypothetical protein
MENNFFQKNNPKRQKLIKPLPQSDEVVEEIVDLLKGTKSAGKGPTMLKMSQKDIESYILRNVF